MAKGHLVCHAACPHGAFKILALSLHQKITEVTSLGASRSPTNACDLSALTLPLGGFMAITTDGTHRQSGCKLSPISVV